MSNTEQDHAEKAVTSRAQEMLLDFLRECERSGDSPECPVCGYDLKGLTRAVCPECGHDLVLTVGVPPPRMGWLLVALAPGFFSGIAAAFVLVPIVGRLIFGDGQMSPALNALDLFGWCSGIFAVLLAVKRHRFLAMPRAHQRWWAIAIWSIHVLALALFILIGPAYL